MNNFRQSLLRSLSESSFKSLLLWLLLPSSLCVVIFTVWSSIANIDEHVNKAFDRSLAGALYAISKNMHYEDGGISMEQPFYLLEFIELTTNSKVYFRVITSDGLTEIGYVDLPLPSESLEYGTPFFEYGEYLGESVRVATMLVEMPISLENSSVSSLYIQVAETQEDRNQVIQQYMWETILSNLLMLLLLFGFIYLAVVLTSSLIRTTSKNIEDRRLDDLRPLDEKLLPREMRPLTRAINSHIERYAKKAEQQRTFLDDASHQLRTPLSVIHTQLEYAENLSDSPELTEVLGAAKNRLQKTVELTNQFLSLARVQGSSGLYGNAEEYELIELNALVEQTVSENAIAALKKKMDYGFEPAQQPVYINAIAWLIREALNNLITNAIRYCDKGAVITVAVIDSENEAVLQLRDNGPGMNEADLAGAGKRFRQGQEGKKQDGFGLGLAIVQSVMDTHQGEFEIFNNEDDVGLCTRLVFRKNSQDKQV
ncbi:MAG TPA: sensor histidine kinase [Oligella sp.]|nr:sensor histidine kinase [Alcaligenaceae bacterium]HZJ97135.1 sensor histidine kinase [Oligella sp.]